MTKQFLEGHLIRKRFGQHFLTDQSVINSIIALIHPKKDQAMVEIGPGLGALTKPILQHLDNLTVIERDRDLSKQLQKNLFLRSKLTIYQKDVLSVNFRKLAKKNGKLLRVFGNLPYNISTPLIFHLLNYVDSIIDMHFMLQKEVATRLAAEPHNKAYGRLSVMAQYFCSITLVFDVPPEAFTPSPKVNSSVVWMVPHKKKICPVNNLFILNHITTEAFSHRRKTIQNSLSRLFTRKALMELGIDLTLRAENISVTQYCKLANYISSIDKG